MRAWTGAIACAVVLPVLFVEVGCGAAPTGEVQTASVPSVDEGPARPYPEAPEDWGTYHSRRFGMTVPLPSPRAWKIDDHTRLYLTATEPGTHSTLLVLSEEEPTLVNHDMCEARAREAGLIPTTPAKVIEDAVTTGPEAYDTRVRVAIENPGETRLVGHLLAIGAYVKKCLVVHLETEVASADDEQALSQRLALARVKMLDGIRTDAPRAVGRLPESPP